MLYAVLSSGQTHAEREAQPIDTAQSTDTSCCYFSNPGESKLSLNLYLILLWSTSATPTTPARYLDAQLYRPVNPQPDHQLSSQQRLRQRRLLRRW